MRDPYEVLGVSNEATPDELKAAYRRKAMQYHPDRNPGDAEAEERFKEVSEAYATLRDPATRARYDRYGANDPGSFRPDTSNVDWQDIFRDADINIDWDARGGMPGSGGAIFDALFGMMTGMLRNAGLVPGQTYAVALPVTLGDLHHGASKRIRVPGPCICPTCQGSGRVNADTAAAAPGAFEVSRPAADSADQSVCPDCNGRGVRRGGASLEVSVPAGASAGAKLRLKGAGGPGNPPGDVLAQLGLQLPESAKLVGRDVHDTVTITPPEARRGATIDYQGLSIVVPPGTEEGARLRFGGKGLPGNGGGDLLLDIEFDWLRGATRLAGDWFRKLVRGGDAS